MAIKIRSGGPAAGRQRYKQSVEAALQGVRQAQTGRLVLKRLNAAQYDVIIEPNLVPGKEDFNNAFELAASASHAGNSRLGQSARGTRSIIMFSPKRLTGKGVQMAFHEVLLHELCHSLRTVYGRNRLDQSGGLLSMSGNFDNVEEFDSAHWLAPDTPLLEQSRLARSFALILD